MTCSTPRPATPPAPTPDVVGRRPARAAGAPCCRRRWTRGPVPAAAGRRGASAAGARGGARHAGRRADPDAGRRSLAPAVPVPGAAAAVALVSLVDQGRRPEADLSRRSSPRAGRSRGNEHALVISPPGNDDLAGRLPGQARRHAVAGPDRGSRRDQHRRRGRAGHRLGRARDPDPALHAGRPVRSSCRHRRRSAGTAPRWSASRPRSPCPGTPRQAAASITGRGRRRPGHRSGRPRRRRGRAPRGAVVGRPDRSAARLLAPPRRRHVRRLPHRAGAGPDRPRAPAGGAGRAGLRRVAGAARRVVRRPAAGRAGLGLAEALGLDAAGADGPLVGRRGDAGGGRRATPATSSALVLLDSGQLRLRRSPGRPPRVVARGAHGRDRRAPGAVRRPGRRCCASWPDELRRPVADAYVAGLGPACGRPRPGSSSRSSRR